MNTRADRLGPRREIPLEFAARRSLFNGVTIDVTECWDVGEAEQDMAYEGYTRLTGLLRETGGRPCEPCLKRGQACAEDYRPRNMQFAPAGQRLRGYGADTDYIKDVSFVLMDPAIETRLGSRLSLYEQSPRLRFADDRIWPLVRLMADAMAGDDPIEPLRAASRPQKRLMALGQGR